jgi:tripartite-type tricarboxylate transporter receptor subunit TctC
LRRRLWPQATLQLSRFRPRPSESSCLFRREAGLTIAESGVAGFELSSWYAIFAPAAAPVEIVRTLHQQTVKALGSAGMREQFAGLGAEPVGGTPEELPAVVQRDIKKWAKAARDAGVKPE